MRKRQIDEDMLEIEAIEQKLRKMEELGLGEYTYPEYQMLQRRKNYIERKYYKEKIE